MIVTARRLLIVPMSDCPKDCYPRRYGDHSGDGDRLINGDHPRYCEFPRILKCPRNGNSPRVGDHHRDGYHPNDVGYLFRQSGVFGHPTQRTYGHLDGSRV